MNKCIHRALRRDLDRFRRALDAFPDGDRGRAVALHRAWANFDAQLTEHHQGEHEVAWPALKAIGIPVLTIERFDIEHHTMAVDLATTRAAMGALSASASKIDADTAAAAMERLQTTTVTHLEHEEETIEGPLLAHEDDPAVKEMGRKFSRRSGPTQAGVFFAWMQDGATADEKAALRESVPAPVLAVLGGVLGRRYRREIAPVWTT